MKRMKAILLSIGVAATIANVVFLVARTSELAYGQNVTVSVNDLKKAFQEALDAQAAKANFSVPVNVVKQPVDVKATAAIPIDGGKSQPIPVKVGGTVPIEGGNTNAVKVTGVVGSVACEDPAKFVSVKGRVDGPFIATFVIAGNFRDDNPGVNISGVPLANSQNSGAIYLKKNQSIYSAEFISGCRP